MTLIFGRVLATGQVIPLQVDANGVLSIAGSVTLGAALPAGTNNIGDVDVLTLPALPAGTNEIGKIQARSYGWYSSNWYKNPLHLGYSDVLRKETVNTNLSAGTNFLDIGPVPANTLWVIEWMAVSYTGTVAGVSLTMAILDAGAIYPYLYRIYPPVSLQWYDRVCALTMKAGETIRCDIGGATAGDDAFFNIAGRIIDLTT